MSTQTVRNFSQHVDASSTLQARIRSMTSVGELMALATELGFQLTGDDLRELAQQAYRQWLHDLNPQSRPFFERLHEDELLNKRHQSCRTPEEVLAIASEYGFNLTHADLQQAAEAAASQDGFSFEKLWFQSLGML